MKKSSDVPFLIVLSLLIPLIVISLLFILKKSPNKNTPSFLKTPKALNETDKAPIREKARANFNSKLNQQKPADAIQLPVEETLELLKKACEGKNRTQLQQAVQALNNLGANDISILVSLLKRSSTSCEKYAAVMALSNITDEKAIAPLIDFIEDSAVNPNFKYNAVRSLAKFNPHNNRVLKAIEKRMADPNENKHLRLVSALSMGTMAKNGNHEAIEYLINGMDAPSASVQYKCVQALADAPTARALESLLQKLISTTNRDVKIRILKTLGFFNNSDSIDALIQVVETSEDIFFKIIAIRSLAQLDDHRAIECLQKSAHGKNKELAQTAQKALGKILKQQ